MKPKLVQEVAEEYLRSAQPHLIIHVDPLGGPRFELTPYIGQNEYDREEIIDEGYDPYNSPLGSVYWRIVKRGEEKFYCSTFRATREQVISAWGTAGLIYCDHDTEAAFARIETKLTNISCEDEAALATGSGGATQVRSEERSINRD